MELKRIALKCKDLNFVFIETIEMIAALIVIATGM